MQKITGKVIASIEKLKEDTVKTADFIFNNPETGGEEHKAKEKLTHVLSDNGFIINDYIDELPTSFTAEYEFPKKGPTVAFIAEYDALPEIGHACHHHIIAASSAFTAVALSKLKTDLAGRIKVIGTQAEENSDAKRIMIDKGIFDDVDVAIMLHGGPKSTTNLELYSLIGMEFTFIGKSAHAAAAPYKGINALDAVILLFNSINALRQQLPEDVRIHGIITEGGTALNIIPERGVAKFYIRTKNYACLEEVAKKIENCARGASMQTGAKLDLKVFEGPVKGLLKNPYLIETYESSFKALGGEIDESSFILGSSDIGNLSNRIPVLNPMIKTSGEECCLHTRDFLNAGNSDFAYDQMVLGMKAIGITCAKVLLYKDYLKKVNKAFNSSL